MKVSEYDLLLQAFEKSFGFMLNRIWEAWDLPGDPHDDNGKKTLALDRCFNEFLLALEEGGVELEDTEATK